VTRFLIAVLFLVLSAHAEDCLPNEFQHSGSPEFDQLAREQYSDWLKESGEPCLYDIVRKHGVKEIYRFTWGGSLHYLRYIVVRLEINGDGSGTAYIKARERGNGKKRRETPKNEIKPISKEKVDTVRRMLVSFWSKPYTDNVMGLDGTGWDLEVVKDGNFHAVTRWSPKGRDKEFYRIGEYFLYKIANIKLDHSFIG
jgi:hypothetical protein